MALIATSLILFTSLCIFIELIAFVTKPKEDTSTYILLKVHLEFLQSFYIFGTIDFLDFAKFVSKQQVSSIRLSLSFLTNTISGISLLNSSVGVLKPMRPA